MAHYVFVRDDGDGYPDFIANIERMTITEDPWMAQQFDEPDFEYIDSNFLRRNGFVPIGITAFHLRILPERQFRRPLIAGLMSLLNPPAKQRRPHAPTQRPVPPYQPGMPKGPRGPMNRPMQNPVGPLAGAKPMSRPVSNPSSHTQMPPRPAQPAQPRTPVEPMGPRQHGPSQPERRNPVGGPVGGPLGGPMGPKGRR